MSRFLFMMVVLLTSTTATATHRQPRLALLFHEHGSSSGNQGANVDPGTGGDFAVPPLLKASPTFLEFHSGRVENDLMLFQPTLVGITSSGRARELDLFAAAPAKEEARRFVAVNTAEDLEVRRDRDRLLMFRGPQPQGADVALGLAMFGAMTVLSAHAPRALRIIFDGPVHLGPAIFDGGGMGAGIAGRGL